MSKPRTMQAKRLKIGMLIETPSGTIKITMIGRVMGSVRNGIQNSPKKIWLWIDEGKSKLELDPDDRVSLPPLEQEQPCEM